MSNLVFIGKYTLCEENRPAIAKRILNQVTYLARFHNIRVFTFSSLDSNLPFNRNLYANDRKKLSDFFRVPLYGLIIGFELFKRKQEKNYLILESNIEIFTIIPLFFARLLGYRIIHDVVEDFGLEEVRTFNQKLNFKVSNWYSNRLSKYCSGIMVISNKLLIKYKPTEVPIIKLYNSVESRQVNFDIERPNNFHLFYSGTFAPKDGVKELIQAVIVLNKKRSDVHLDLVGKGDGQYFKDCIEMTRNYECISYHGFLPESEMISLLERSHILCVTRSNCAFANFGFPFKLAEYLSFGLPVLTTTVSDIPELLSDGETAFFAEPGNINSIAMKIESIINDYAKAKEVGKNGKDFCDSNFSIEKIGNQMNEFLVGI